MIKRTCSDWWQLCVSEILGHWHVLNIGLNVLYVTKNIIQMSLLWQSQFSVWGLSTADEGSLTV